MRDDLVTVASFDNDLDARLAQECLAGAGIRAFLADHSLVGTAWHLAGALGGVKLQVSASQRGEAAAILAKAQAGEGGAMVLHHRRVVLTRRHEIAQ